MAKLTKKHIGGILIGISITLLIILGWVKFDVDKQEAFICQTIDKDPALTMEDCPVHKSNVSWLMVVAFGIVFLILASGIVILLFPQSASMPAPKAVFQEIDIAKLSEEEKQVYGLLKNKGGSAYQSDIVKETGFSKVRVTRILDRMASQQLIDRQRRGMTNLVVLK